MVGLDVLGRPVAGGTPLTATDAYTILTSTGFTNVTPIPTPPGAPALYCGQRPPTLDS